MKVKIWLGVLALASMAAGSADARHYKVETSVSRFIGCYTRVYVPAVVAVNTRGRLVRPGGRHWSIDVADDNWDLLRDAPVYMQSVKVVDPDHYTLISKNCATGLPADPLATPAPLYPNP